jgi:hypothetical protein
MPATNKSTFYNESVSANLPRKSLASKQTVEKLIKRYRHKKAHIAVSLVLLVAETGIEPVTRGFSTLK